MGGSEEQSWVVPAGTRIGRVLLRVGSIDEVVPFYRDVVGLEEVERGGQVALGSGESPLIVFEEDADGRVRSPSEAGLFHIAIRVPTRGALGDVLRRIQRSEWTLHGASDHRVSEALYLSDPAGNGVEVYRDRPREEWPVTSDGLVDMDTLPLDLDGVVEESSDSGERVPAGTDIGHVHLEVIDIASSVEWYEGGLGLSVMARYGNDAVFLAAGGYHHHVGLNTWNARTDQAQGSLGLEWFEVVIPSTEAYRSVLDRVGHQGESDSEDMVVRDPNGIGVRLSAATL